jgi:predicted Zn-dependent protease
MLRILLPLLILSSCSLELRPVEREQTLDAKLFRDFDIIRNQQLQSYLESLKTRLFEDYLVENFATEPKIYISKDEAIYALSFSSGSILISSALISACDSESELAFVLAHEYSHSLLKHFEDNKTELSNQQVKQKELDADAKALSIIFEAGFSIQGAADSISKFDLHQDSYTNSHPSKQERLNNLRQILIKDLCSGSESCLSYGTLDSRAFREIRSYLALQD